MGNEEVYGNKGDVGKEVIRRCDEMGWSWKRQLKTTIEARETWRGLKIEMN